MRSAHGSRTAPRRRSNGSDPFLFRYRNANTKRLMAGRSPKDLADRNTKVIQVCLTEDQAFKVQKLAKASEHKTVSVWLRAQIKELLTAS